MLRDDVIVGELEILKDLVIDSVIEGLIEELIEIDALDETLLGVLLDGEFIGVDVGVCGTEVLDVRDSNFDIESVLDEDGEIEEVIDSLRLTEFVGESVILALVDGD